MLFNYELKINATIQIISIIDLQLH